MIENDGEGIPVRRIVLWTAVACGVLALLVGGGLYGWPKYKAWTSAKALRLAQEAHRAGELRNQELYLEQAVQMDSANLEARRQFAAFKEQQGDPLATEMWTALVALDPLDFENRKGLVLSLLRRGGRDSAQKILAETPESQRSEKNYLRVAAAVAMENGDLQSLERFLGLLAAQDSAPGGLQISKAGLELGSADAQVRAQARATLVALAKQDGFRIRATLVLLRSLKPASAKVDGPELAKAILSKAGEGLLSRDGPVEKTLDLTQYMMGQPAPSPEDAAALMEWMQGQGMARAALFWCSTQVPALRSSMPVLARRAACAMQLRHWRELRETVGLGVWGGIGEDTLTLVFASRIQWDQGSTVNARATWADAMAQVERQPTALRVMQRLAAGWGWKPEELRCLELLVNYYPQEDLYWRGLLQHAQFDGSANRTMEVLEQWCHVRGDPPAVLEEEFLLGSLLGVLGAERAQQLASYATHEEVSPVVRIALALQACREGRPASVEGLSSAGLSPRARLALAVVLLQQGKGSQAKEALLGLGQVVFLPEERSLIARIEALKPIF